MKHTIIYINPILSFPMIFILFILGIGLVFFSYYQTTENIKTKTHQLWREQQADVTEAFQQFQKYQNLLESRLLRSLDRKDAILRILSERVEHTIASNFPSIISLAFISSLDPSIKYTRIGKTLLDLQSKEEEKKNSVRYLGDGFFKINKILYDQSQKKVLGTLQSTISINHLLNKHFAESEIGIWPEKDQHLSSNLLSFKVMGLPYIFVLNRSFPRFWGFLYEFRLQILFALLFGTLLLLIGLAIGASFRRKILLRQHALIQKRRESLKTIGNENINLVSQLKASQNLLKLQENALKVHDFLFHKLQERYRQMASRAQAINVWTPKLISECAGNGNDKLIKEIYNISEESNLILRRMVNGYLMKEVEEKIDFFQAIQDIKSMFLPQIIEKNIKFEIVGKIKKLPTADQVILEIVLYNIFNIVMNRLLKDNVFRIVFKGHDPLHVIFYDDGYDVDEKIHTVKNKPNLENILHLNKRGLGEFVSYLGWRISFKNENSLFNSIKLSIPLILNENDLPENIIKLFDYKQPHSHK